MKTTFTILVILLSINFAKSQNLELPFYDDFEETGNDVTFLNWNTENTAGWQYWHIFYGKMRFENNDLDQNDWLITEPIKTMETDSLLIRFNTLYKHQGTKPKFYYTSQYTGDAQNDTWIEIEYELGEVEEQWQSSGDIVIKNPDSTVWFAFHSNQEANKGIYFLLDDFSVSKYDPVITSKVGETDHFEFYTDNEDNIDFWLELKDALENSFRKYCGIWNIQGKEDFIDKNTKTKVYYTERANIPFVNETTPETKSGFFDRATKTIYLSPLDTTEKQVYYESLEGLAINTFAGYAKKHQLFRDQNGYDVLPDYYTEGFGLYEQGFRPRLDSIIKAREEHPYNFTHEDLDIMNVFSNTYEKDIIVSYVEGQIVGLLDYNGTAPYGSHIPRWNKHLIHFYDTTDIARIKKYASNENFDIYCSARDTMFIDSFFVWLERPRQFYIDSFQIEVNRKFNLIIYFDEKTGMDMTGYDNWNGGAGGMNISPHNFGFGIYDRYNGLLAHEFGHVYNSVISPEMPFGFYHEGMAELSNLIQTGDEHLDSYWEINYVFDYYLNKHGREPTLEEIINNPHEGQPGLEYGIDCYFFGFAFMCFLRNTEGLLKMKEFFTSGLDFNVFEMSYAEIEQGYIDYLKYLSTLRDNNSPTLVINTGITLQQGTSTIITTSNLHATDKEVTDDNLHFIMRKAPEHGHLEKVNNPGIPVFKFTEKDLKDNQIKYVNNGNINTSDSFTFKVTDRTFIIDYQTFTINIATSTAIFDLPENTYDLHVVPNPINHNSRIEFTLKNAENVELAIFDIQGRKISNILNVNLDAGNHAFPVGKYLSKKGIYLCRLKTDNNVSNVKIIVD